MAAHEIFISPQAWRCTCEDDGLAGLLHPVASFAEASRQIDIHKKNGLTAP